MGAIITRVSGRSSFGRVDYYSQAGKHKVDNYHHLHTTTSSCRGGYNPSLDYLMMTMDTLILGEFRARHSSWYSRSTDSRGTMLESMVSGSNFGILNCDSPTRLSGNANPRSPDVSFALVSLYHFYQLADKEEPRPRLSINPH